MYTKSQLHLVPISRRARPCLSKSTPVRTHVWIFTGHHLVIRGPYILRSPGSRFQSGSSSFNNEEQQLYCLHLKNTLRKRDNLNKELISKDFSILSASFIYLVRFILLQRHPTSLIKQSGEECWVRFCSSTLNVLWPWNNNDRRLRLSNVTKEIKLEAPTSSRRAERSWTLKQRIKTLTLLEHYYVHLFDILRNCILHNYYQSYSGGDWFVTT